MYQALSQELVGIGEKRRFLNQRLACRFCGTSDASSFGKKANAHTFPEALGNRSLFSLDECVACNAKFALYEDALCKAVGPFLTLGGTRGKGGVRQTGRTKGDLVLKHQNAEGKRQLLAIARDLGDLSRLATLQGEVLSLRIPVSRESFIPLYAYKALLKIAVSILPSDKLPLFQKSLLFLKHTDQPPGQYPVQVGFSYAFIGNSPPTLGGAVLQIRETNPDFPFLIALFQAGSVCFQIALHPDDTWESVVPIGRLGIIWKSMFRKPDGTFYPIAYSDPVQFDWSGLGADRQPFEAFDLKFNTRTCFGEFTPVKSVQD